MSIAAGTGAVLLYLLGTAMQLRRLSRSAPVLLQPLIAVGIPALLLHALTTISVIYTPAGIHLGFFSTGSLVTLVMTAFVMLASLLWYVPQAGHLGSFERVVIFFGVGVITASTRSPSRFWLMWRRRSPSVTMPTRRPSGPMTPTQP